MTKPKRGWSIQDLRTIFVRVGDQAWTNGHLAEWRPMPRALARLKAEAGPLTESDIVKMQEIASQVQHAEKVDVAIDYVRVNIGLLDRADIVGDYSGPRLSLNPQYYAYLSWRWPTAVWQMPKKQAWGLLAQPIGLWVDGELVAVVMPVMVAP